MITEIHGCYLSLTYVKTWQVKALQTVWSIGGHITDLLLILYDGYKAMDTDKGRKDKFLERPESCLNDTNSGIRAEKDENTLLKSVLYILQSLLVIVIKLVTITLHEFI